MDNAAILECLDQKKELFAQYEECTAKMNVCEIGDLQNYITQRARLANEIDKLNLELDAFCQTADDPEQMRDALANRGDYEDFPGNLRPLYDKSAEIFTHINHVYNLEPQIKLRMTQERANLLQKIKGGQGTAKVYNYVKNLSQGPESGVYIGEKKI